MRLLLAAILLVQAAPAQSEADKVEAALKRIGERKYRLYSLGKESGSCTLKTTLEKDGDGKVAVFEDRNEGESEVVIEKAALPALTLRSITIKDLQGRFIAVATVRDGKADVQTADERKTVDVTPSTLGLSAMFRLLCLKPQEVGTTFKIDILIPGHFLLKDNTFRCAAKESVEIGGAKLDAFRWDHTAQRSVDTPEGTRTLSLANSYWIGTEGYMLRFTAKQQDRVVKEMRYEPR